MMDAARVDDRGRGRPRREAVGDLGIVKYHVTERDRRVVNDAMDIQGGKGICLGPNNFSAAPTSRSRSCDHRRGREHPDAQPDHLRPGRDPLPSLRAAGRCGRRTKPTARGASRGLRRGALRPHRLHARQRRARARCMGLTGSHWVAACPRTRRPRTRRYYQQLTRFSAAFAFLADVSMLVLGGALKRREKLSARLGDILSLMYLASATLKRYEDEGRQQADVPLLRLVDLGRDVHSAQKRVRGRPLQLSRAVARDAAALRRSSRSACRYVVPSTRSATRCAKLADRAGARRATGSPPASYVPTDEADATGALEAALLATVAASRSRRRSARRRSGAIAPRQASTRPSSRATRASSPPKSTRCGSGRRRCATRDRGRRLPAGLRPRRDPGEARRRRTGASKGGLT